MSLGKPLDGACIGKVVESKNNQFAVGDYVLGMNGWSEYWISDGSSNSGATKIDSNLGPIQFFLGIFGMPGLTAYVGLLKIGQLKEGLPNFKGQGMLCNRKRWFKRESQLAY
jgi:NADPH-dependent curcumin reductase CurA